MDALVVFHGAGAGWLAGLLKPGFRHVFCAISDGRYWIAIDGKAGVPEVKVAAAANYDLASFYREQGFRVLETKLGADPPCGPFAAANCVGLVKAMLALSAPLAFTPYRLYRTLIARGAASSAGARLTRRQP